MRRIGVLTLGLFALTALGQELATQLPDVPPKPTCTPWLNTGTCADLWRNYNQAVARRQQAELQLYINRQKELASEAATAPLQQQISDLTKLTADQQAQITKLQKQMQSDAAAALEARQADAAEARQQGLWEGLEIGAGGAFGLIILVLVIRWLSRKFTISKKPQAASTAAS